MLFILLILYGVLACYYVMREKIKLSQAFLPLLAFAILSSVALGQNYTQSLISEVNDGIGVSNFLARFILGDDGWSTALFLEQFELYIWISLVLIVIYFVAVLVEKSTGKEAYNKKD